MDDDSSEMTDTQLVMELGALLEQAREDAVTEARYLRREIADLTAERDDLRDQVKRIRRLWLGV